MTLTDVRVELFHWHQSPPPGIPARVLEAVRQLLDEMEAAQWPPLNPSAPLPPAPTVAASGAPPQRLSVAADPVTPGRLAVRAKDPSAARSARTIQVLLDAMAGFPISPLSDALLEFATVVEALELENATLRAQLAEQVAAQRGHQKGA